MQNSSKMKKRSQNKKSAQPKQKIEKLKNEKSSKTKKSSQSNIRFLSSSIMAEIADLTYNTTAFPEIMGMLWKRLSDHGKNWRHVYKSLMLLDYLVKTGSERVSNQCKENIYAIQTLKDFQFTDT